MTGILNTLIAGVSGAVKDAYFNLVSLLLPGNGTNGAQNNTFLDSSTNNFTITRNGNTTQGTFSPFSQTGWGNYFDGSGDYLSVSSNAAFGFGTGDFTIEYWIYPSLTGDGNQVVIDARSSSSAIPWLIGQTTGGAVRYYDGTTIRTGGTMTANTWNHVAWCRASNVNNVYLNGTSVSTYTASQDFGSSNPLTLGSNINTATERTTGYISNLRIVKGTAVYTANFTPPTTPLTAISGTSLLTCQSNRFKDSSSNAFTITSSGGPTVVAFSPFAPAAAYTTAAVGGSGYFDGTGDYLTVPSNAAFDLGTGAFTLEAWVYRTVSGSVNIFHGSSAGLILYTNSSNKAVVRLYGTADLLTSADDVAINTWTHVAVARSGTTLSMWLNGSRSSGGTVTNSSNFGQTGVIIGANDIFTGLYSGYMSSVRLVKGAAVYDPTLSSITVPTSPLTAVSGTSILLNYTNAGITDATAKNDLETVGNAQISTSVSKFGGGSIAFDGTGDYLFEPHSTLYEFGSGDFTIEFWARANSLSGTYTGVVGVWLAGTAATANSWNVSLNAFNTTNKFGFSYTQSSTSYDLIFNATTSTGSWDHYAIVRLGGTLYGFKNGTSQTLSSGSSTISGAINNGTNGLYVGTVGTAGGGTDFNGYIDDLRITKGYARYTSNFTAPTAPFPVQ